ncbi:MAG: glutathione S-transferase [Porticoccaceae bacterium]|nr:glutathione S-transferase [Porticoccaceae bacterium]MDG1474411.1 glutathione S-transferase [Porticoccaceae bacterium]
MLTIHHLVHSRSQRIIWLCEEINVDYKVLTYQRDPVTSLAPPSLEKIHPLGKSPVITDDSQTIIESGAIIDYLLRKHGNGQFRPVLGTWHHEQYLQWLHYGESGAALPLMLKLYTSKLPDSGEALQPRISDELERHLGYIEQSLEGVEWLVGNAFSGADIQLSFVAEIAPLLHTVDKLPNLLAFRDRCQNRSAYRRALSKTEPYAYGPK